MSILPPDGDLQILHHRTYDTKVYTDGTDLIARGAICDRKPPGTLIAGDTESIVMHHMVIELRIAVPTLEITGVKLDFEEFPHPECPSIIKAYEQLVGLSIARGFTHKTRELFGGPRGCTHVVALLQALAPAVVQSTWSLSKITESSNGPAAEDGEIRNLNTCHIWAEDGPQIQLIRRGERGEPPIPAVRRLIELGRDPDEFYDQ